MPMPFGSLFEAYEIEDLDVINTLISNGADVNLQNKDGDTILILAVSSAINYFMSHLIKILIDNENIKVDIKNNDGLTALMIASANGYPLTVTSLIDKRNANVEIQDYENNTSLILACLGLIFVLSPEATEVKMERVEDQAVRDFIVVIEKLLSSGANVDSLNVLGESAISLIEYNNIQYDERLKQTYTHLINKSNARQKTSTADVESNPRFNGGKVRKSQKNIIDSIYFLWKFETNDYI
jgi:ankyrin repeat protein